MDARRVVDRFDEIEVELVEGDDEALRPIAKRLRRAGARVRELAPKLFRALGPPAEEPPPETLAGEAEILRAALSEQVSALIAHDPGTRLGSDPEELHDMRVAIRRLRAFLKTAGAALDPAWRDDLRSRLKWLASELSPVRDLDVMTARLGAGGTSRDDPEARAVRRLVDALDDDRREARTAMLAALRSDRYFELLDDLERAVRSPRITGEVDLAARASKAFRRLQKRAREITADSPDEALHEVRKTGKKARYAAELAGPMAGKRADRFVKKAKAFQDVVGEHQDAAVAEERLRALAATRSGSSLLAAGRLIEQEHTRRGEARTAFPRAWRRLEKAGKAAWT